jgi:hypothetical protein
MHTFTCVLKAMKVSKCVRCYGLLNLCLTSLQMQCCPRQQLLCCLLCVCSL